MKFSLVIPCYNEAGNLPLILDRFATTLTRNDIELILVDNGSRDNTQEVLARLLPNYPFARTITVEVNQGYGYGICIGLRSARGEYAGWTHADMQTDPFDALRALEIIEKRGSPNNIYLKGSRRGRSVFDVFFTICMSLFETVYLKEWLWDINAQPNVFHRSFLDTWKNPPNDFSIEVYSLFLAQHQRLTVVRFPVVMLPRVHGLSSWNTSIKAKWKYIKRTLDFSMRLKKGLSR